MGMVDEDGQYNLALFSEAVVDAENEYRKQGKNISELYNPNSKDYIGHLILKYRSSPSQLLKKLGTDRKTQFTPPEGVKETRKENESANDYLKRIGAGG